MSTKRALVCAPLLPEYDRESGSRRTFHLIEFLREAGWAVTFIAENGSAGRRYVTALQQRGVETYLGFDSRTEQLIASCQFDLAVFAFWYLAESYMTAIRRISPGTRVIVDTIDLHFLREARRIFQEPGQDGLEEVRTQSEETLLPAAQNQDLRTSKRTRAYILANPNPVPAGAGADTTTISWSTGDGSWGQIYVSVDGGPERLFVEGAEGGIDVDWIWAGKTYEFRLREGAKSRTLLKTVTVTVDSRICGLDSTYAAKMVREVNTYAAADAVLTVSQKEADLVNDLVGDPALAYAVPDCEDLSPSTLPFAERKGISFIGNFRHPPNVDAAEYLCKDILPRLDPTLTAENPVYIVGNGLDKRVRGYGCELPYVRMVGWVPSVLPYLERVRVSVLPLLYGAGTKRKLIQALMVGTPTVSTSIGIEGLSLEDGEHVLVADDPDAFASSIARLLEDPELWQHLACQGRRPIVELRSRDAAQTRLMEAISTVLTKAPKLVKPGELNPKLNGHRLNYQKYQQLIRRIRETVRSALPPDSTVLVVSKGDDELLQLDGQRGWHFPQTEDGAYAGYYPANSAEAIAHLEKLRSKGGEFLLLPSTALWWLEHYGEFKQHLGACYQRIWGDEICVMYQLSEPKLRAVRRVT